MKGAPTMEDFLRKWMKADRIEDAHLEIKLALEEYRDLNQAGTVVNREKLAKDNLDNIERHARGLSSAINAMPNRAKFAILEHRNNSGMHDLFEKWVRDLMALREDVLLPLANIAKGACDCLPAQRGRGRVKKTAGSPRDALVDQLAVLYRDAGSTRVPHLRGGESQELAFIRDLLECVGIEVPNDLARVLRGATAIKSKKN